MTYIYVSFVSRFYKTLLRFYFPTASQHPKTTKSQALQNHLKETQSNTILSIISNSMSSSRTDSKSGLGSQAPTQGSQRSGSISSTSSLGIEKSAGGNASGGSKPASTPQVGSSLSTSSSWLAPVRYIYFSFSGYVPYGSEIVIRIGGDEKNDPQNSHN